MFTTAVVILSVAVVLPIFFVSRTKIGFAADHDEVRKAADATAVGTADDPAQHAARKAQTDASQHAAELALREFAFHCAVGASSKQAACDKAAPLLARLDAPRFNDFVHGTIDDFIEAYSHLSPLRQYLEVLIARHEREQYQIAHGLPVKGLQDDGSASTTVAEELGLTLDDEGEWVRREPVQA